MKVRMIFTLYCIALWEIPAAQRTDASIIIVPKGSARDKLKSGFRCMSIMLVLMKSHRCNLINKCLTETPEFL